MRYGTDLMTLKEVTAFFDCTPTTIYNLRKRGLIRGIYPYGPGPGKTVLFERRTIEEYFATLSGSAAMTF
jgi:hypothetical protein